MGQLNATEVAFGRLCQSLTDTGRIDRIVVPVTAGTLNPVELGEVVGTCDKKGPYLDGLLPEIGCALLPSNGPVGSTWGESCERAKDAEKASRGPPVTVSLDRDGHLVSASRMARLRILGMLDDVIREHAVDIIDRMHWVVSAAERV